MTSATEKTELEDKRGKLIVEIQLLRAEVKQINLQLGQIRVQDLKDSGVLAKLTWHYQSNFMFPLGFVANPDWTQHEEVKALVESEDPCTATLQEGIVLRVQEDDLSLEVEDTENFPAFAKEWGLSFSTANLDVDIEGHRQAENKLEQLKSWLGNMAGA